MATRTSFRARPVDINKQLVIVRDLSELDSTEGLVLKEETPAPEGAPGTSSAPQDVQGGAAASSSVPGTGAGKNTLSQSTPAGTGHKKPKPKEIPVPEVKMVPTYTRDYLPTFKIPETYIRGKGGTNYDTDDYVEYDLDNEDEDWLESFNRGSDHRLEDTKLERMLWRLELAWWEVTEPTLSQSERVNPVHLQSIARLPKVQGVVMLRKAVGGRDVILDAVYEHWAQKRKRWNKPILRRLQAPTNPTDTNPYNVFRPREKANRPLTRRRRENTTECWDKFLMLRTNMARALQLGELTILREKKKDNLHNVAFISYKLELDQRHMHASVLPTAEQLALRNLALIGANNNLAKDRVALYTEYLDNPTILTEMDRCTHAAVARKRKRLETDLVATLAVASVDTLAKVPDPVPVPDLEPMWAYTPSLPDLVVKAVTANKPAPCDLSPDVQTSLSAGAVQAYIGRGGRVVLARCDPVTLDPVNAEGEEWEGAQAVVMDGAPQGGAGDIQDADVYSFHPQEPAPWALALDMGLLPEHIDKAPIVAEHQKWLKLHGGGSRGTASGFALSPWGGRGGTLQLAGRQRSVLHRSASPRGGMMNGPAGGHKLLPQARATSGPSSTLNRGPGRPAHSRVQGGGDLSLPGLDAGNQ